MKNISRKRVFEEGKKKKKEKKEEEENIFAYCSSKYLIRVS